MISLGVSLMIVGVCVYMVGAERSGNVDAIMSDFLNNGQINNGDDEKTIGVVLIIIGVIFIVVSYITKASKQKVSMDKPVFEYTATPIRKVPSLEEDITCKKCGKSISDNAAYCEHCGEKVEKNIHCFQCGAERQAEARFCSKCGIDFENSSK